MNITSISQVEYKNAYGILCHSLPKKGLSDALNPTFCRIETGGETTLHKHFEPEIFFIILGQGEMTIDENSRAIHAGDLVQIPAFSTHTLKNTGAEPLHFLSIYTEDFTVPKLPNDVLITAAPPTPNGPLHLGHISGPYLGADVLARYLESKNADVVTHTGTDDYQNYVGEKARTLKLSVDEFRTQQRTRIQRGLSTTGIQFDEFIEPAHDQTYQDKIRIFFDRALAAGVIQLENVNLPHCAHCDLTLVDVHADGTCPECNSPSRGGCETCGIVVPAYQLKNLHCGRCGQVEESLQKSVYTFDLQKYLPLIAPDLAQLNLSPRLQQLVDTIKSQPSSKILVAYPTENDLGIRVDGLNLHVWFEMAAHYETFALSTKFWIHSFGFDNSFYYLLFIPALLKALNANAKLPDAVITNEFLLLDGAKFSTSRGHAIWADEFTGNAEHLRLFLSSIRPAQQTSNFELTAFEAFSLELEASLENVLNQAELIGRLESNLAKENSIWGLDTLGEAHPQAVIQSQRFLKDFEMAMAPQNFDTRNASRLILNFLDLTVQSLGVFSAQDLDIAPLQNHKVKTEFNSKALANDKIRIQSLATALTAFMPKTSDKLAALLSFAVPQQLQQPEAL